MGHGNGNRRVMKIELDMKDDLQSLIKRMDKLDDNLKKKGYINSLMAGGREMRKAVKNAAPVGDIQSPASQKYGKLKSNIKLRQLKQRSPKDTPAVMVHTGNAFWAKFLELGTRRQAAKPWMRPAVDAASSAVFAKFGEALKKQLARFE